MRRLIKDELFYVFLVRVTHKGELIYKKNLHKVMTQDRMNLMLQELSQQYHVPMATVAFEFEQLIGIRRLSQLLLNEFWSRCIIEWKSKNLRQYSQRKK